MGNTRHSTTEKTNPAPRRVTLATLTGRLLSARRPGPQTLQHRPQHVEVRDHVALHCASTPRLDSMPTSMQSMRKLVRSRLKLTA